MSELVILVDKNDNVLGSKDRDLLTDDDRWRIVTIWITNSAGHVLLAQRSFNMRNNPGKWGPAAGGTVEFDDDYEVTASRELHEELGIDLPLKQLGVRIYKSDIGSRACMFYAATCDKTLEEFTPQASEVEQIAWVNKDDLWLDLETNPDKYLQEFMLLKNIYEK